MNIEILYKQFRNLPARKSPRYLAWLRKRYPDKQVHHLIGSMTGIKLNDLLCVAVTAEEHEQAEREKIKFFGERLSESINNLIIYLEEIK